MKKTAIYTIALLILLGLMGCGTAVTPEPLTLDPVFREFYELKGGEEVLGPPISPPYEEKGRIQQFTSKVLLVFDPEAPRSMQFQFKNLGVEMDIARPPVLPEGADSLEIYPGFLPLFNALGGTQFTGRPLTSVEFEPEYKRIVQYFENVGFYQLESDPPGVAHLLDYGAWKCSENWEKPDRCQYRSPSESIAIFPSGDDIPLGPNGDAAQNFQIAIDRLDPSFTGAPLTGVYKAPDGAWEIIFENVVAYENLASPNGVALRPLADLLGIPATPPYRGSNTTTGIFVAVDGDLGYDVPFHFHEYIKQNGNYEFTGWPVTDYQQLSDTLYRQCFENLCLDYYPMEEAASQISPMALGRRYNQQRSESGNPEGGTNSYEGITLTIWESNPLITSADVQTIHALVQDGGIPLYNVDLELTVTLPDGSQQTLHFPPTDANGRASVTYGPVPGDNADTVTYRVCVRNLPEGSAPECAVDDFLIWGNP